MDFQIFCELSSLLLNLLFFGSWVLEARPSAFYDFVQMYVHHVQMRVQTRRLAHGPFQLAVHECINQFQQPG